MVKYFTHNTGNHAFKLENERGNTLLESIPYTDKLELEKVVANLSTFIERPLLFERKTNYKGEFLFMLKNNEGKVIGNSKLYNSEAGMENGIKNLKKIVVPNTNI
ncbi:YegP family protein [Cellulophaga sp. L1A9]|uniref:YegP family protein n=1 Tax=Cellulophaga sp. L1A9 TaxID=2686362 RepID=UPI00131B08B0|nr:YegP family protein [Cellulophaga sp. L1A9]